MQSWRPNFANRTRTLKLIYYYFMLLLCDLLNWAGQLMARTQLQKGQIDVLLRKITPISSNLIDQILLCFQYRPITYLYVSQMEIIFRLWYNFSVEKKVVCLGRVSNPGPVGKLTALTTRLYWLAGTKGSIFWAKPGSKEYNFWDDFKGTNQLNWWNSYIFMMYQVRSVPDSWQLSWLVSMLKGN